MRPLGRPRSRWENNMKRYLNITGEEDVYFINLVTHRGKGRFVVNMVTKLKVP